MFRLARPNNSEAWPFLPPRRSRTLVNRGIRPGAAARSIA
jgi:hypothetical protein